MQTMAGSAGDCWGSVSAPNTENLIVMYSSAPGDVDESYEDHRQSQLYTCINEPNGRARLDGADQRELGGKSRATFKTVYTEMDGIVVQPIARGIGGIKLTATGSAGGDVCRVDGTTGLDASAGAADMRNGTGRLHVAVQATISVPRQAAMGAAKQTIGEAAPLNVLRID